MALSLKRLIERCLPESLVMHLRAFDNYFFGEPEVRLIKRICRPGCTAVDAGANIGIYTYFLNGHAAEVYAYEPNPGLAGRLHKLMPKVKVRNLALSDSVAELTLKVPLDSKGRLSHELASVAQEFSGPTVDFSVHAVTIDSENLQDVGFIKIDVEQHERAVLRGAMSTIQRCRPNILIEVYPLKYDHELAEEFSFLLNEKYIGWFSWADGWKPLSELDSKIHLRSENFGDSKRFIGNNLLFFPVESPLSINGPM